MRQPLIGYNSITRYSAIPRAMDPNGQLQKLLFMQSQSQSQSQSYQQSYNDRMRELGNRRQHLPTFTEPSIGRAAITSAGFSTASLVEEQESPIFAWWQIVGFTIGISILVYVAGGPWAVILAIWNWIASCLTWTYDQISYFSNRLLQLRLWIGQVLEPYLEPNYASPWANMAVNVWLRLLHPIQTYRSARDWMGQKYNDVRYSQRFTIFTQRLNAVNATLHGLLGGWWQNENGFPWGLVALCIGFCAMIFAKAEYNKYEERQRVIPWYDNRVVRTDAPAHMFFDQDQDPRITAIAQDPTWDAVDNIPTAKSFVDSFTPEDPVRQARQDIKAKPLKDSYTLEHAVRRAGREDSSPPYLFTTDESSFQYSEMSRPVALSAKMVSETVSQPKPKISSQSPVTPGRLTSKRDRLAEERSERKWRDSKLKQATTAGKWEPWKEDMAKDPDKRRWVGQGLTWCLSCKQYHCCELPY